MVERITPLVGLDDFRATGADGKKRLGSAQMEKAREQTCADTNFIGPNPRPNFQGGFDE
jgi:hypothetical protein